MSKIITFRFEPGDTVFYASLVGIIKGRVDTIKYDSHTDVIRYLIGGAIFDEDYLFESVKDLRKNLKYLGDD